MAGISSIGITSTPATGWSCGLPPCTCCKTPMYFSDNRKTWGETGEFSKNCCCGDWTITNVRVQPGGTPYTYIANTPCCPCSQRYMTVMRDGAEVGRVTNTCVLCPCGENTVLEAGATGQPAKYTLRTGGCCKPNGCCPGGCCPKSPGCCDTWVRWDTWRYSGPADQPSEATVATLTTQRHRCCPYNPCCPWWMGFDSVPATMSEDDRALMLGMVVFGPTPLGGTLSNIPAQAVMQ